MDADFEVDLPKGWVERAPRDGIRVFSPDGGQSVVEIHSPVWGNLATDWTDPEIEEMVAGQVEQLGLGRTVGVAWASGANGRRLHARIACAIRDRKASAWFLARPRCYALFITWVGTAAQEGGAARVVDGIRPGAETAALEALIAETHATICERAVVPFALLVRDGVATRVDLAAFAPRDRDAATRDACLRIGAQRVVQVASYESDGERFACIVVATPDAVTSYDVTPTETYSTRRLDGFDFFRAP